MLELPLDEEGSCEMPALLYEENNAQLMSSMCGGSGSRSGSSSCSAGDGLAPSG